MPGHQDSVVYYESRSIKLIYFNFYPLSVRLSNKHICIEKYFLIQTVKYLTRQNLHHLSASAANPRPPLPPRLPPERRKSRQSAK